jgi:NAD(P)-dependent dehydrogenase (short-subunit alcohol dehydrogenase family)
MDQMRFDDDVVIITGGGRGLGREYALAFAARGAAVVINDIGTETGADGAAHSVAETLAASIRDAGGRAMADGHSVVEEAQAIAQTALEAFGKITILVNNAGVIDFGTLEHMDDAVWRRMMAVTLDGAFHMTKAVWPHMAARGYGRIINTTSNAGFAGNEQLTHYGAAKMGVAGLTKALAQEAKATGITVNAIAPMAVTRMNRDAFFGGADVSSDDWQADIRSGKVPMGPPSIVAPTVLWLAHTSTTLNGEIFSTSSGKVARVGFVVANGYFNPDHSPEDLRDHATTIRDISDPVEPLCTVDELLLIPPLFQ